MRSSFWARLYRAREARRTVSSVKAISRQGLTVTDSSSPMVWPVEGTIRRMRSISSPKNSRRTGEVDWAGQTSTTSPWTWKAPAASAPPLSA